MVVAHGSRSDIFQAADNYRLTVGFAFGLLAFAGISITWALQLAGDAVLTESLIGSEFVAGRVSSFMSQTSDSEALSRYRQAFFVLAGAFVVISVASVATVAWLNVALVRTRDLLKKQKSELGSLDVAKERFLSLVTHELNTPITVVTALTDALVKNADGNLTERQLGQLAVVRRNNRQLSDNIEAMIGASSAEIGLGWVTETVRYAEFVETVLEMAQADIALQGKRVESSEIASEVKVDIDSDRINQVITNLLVNAAQNSPEGSVISVSTEISKGRLKTSFRDSGPGISAADGEHVFSPFYRADTENTRRTRGLGIGLTMVQRIVELHGGEVGFDPNREDAGVTFWFTLPIVN